MSLVSIRQAAVSAVAAAALTMTTLIAVSAPAQAAGHAVPAAVDTGCPRGAVCVYPDASWNGGNPTYVFWSYGTHRIYNQFGFHRVYNNQTGGAGSSLCTGTNGTDCTPLDADYFWDTNLTPINSINLFR